MTRVLLAILAARSIVFLSANAVHLPCLLQALSWARHR
jgi:hypothetical protein